MVELYGARPGTAFEPLARAWPPVHGGAAAGLLRRRRLARLRAPVRRDHHGRARLRAPDRRRAASATSRCGWRPGADAAQVQQAVRALAAREPARPSRSRSPRSARSARPRCASSTAASPSPTGCRRWRSRIGLFGIAASFSAQVLARRKEFGLLAHLGFTRAPGAGGGGRRRRGVDRHRRASPAWCSGLAVSVVLVHVVNPQSFHWTMDLLVPWPRLGALCAAVVWPARCTAWLAGRAAAGRDAVLAVQGGLVMRGRRSRAGAAAGCVAPRCCLRRGRRCRALPATHAAVPARLRRHPDLRTEWWYITGHARRRRARVRLPGHLLPLARRRDAGHALAPSRPGS